MLYGDADTRRRESVTKTHDSQPPQLDSTEGTEKKESGGVLRQTLKPDGTFVLSEGICWNSAHVRLA